LCGSTNGKSQVSRHGRARSWNPSQSDTEIFSYFLLEVRNVVSIIVKIVIIKHAYGNLLFLSGILPVANGKLAISGWATTFRLNKARKRLSSLCLTPSPSRGDLDRLKKLVKLTVLVATMEEFTEHASGKWTH
jgi:hypothetical protein